MAAGIADSDYAFFEEHFLLPDERKEITSVKQYFMSGVPLDSPTTLKVSQTRKISSISIDKEEVKEEDVDIDMDMDISEGSNRLILPNAKGIYSGLGIHNRRIVVTGRGLAVNQVIVLPPQNSACISRRQWSHVTERVAVHGFVTRCKNITEDKAFCSAPHHQYTGSIKNGQASMDDLFLVDETNAESDSPANIQLCCLCSVTKEVVDDLLVATPDLAAAFKARGHLHVLVCVHPVKRGEALHAVRGGRDSWNMVRSRALRTNPHYVKSLHQDACINTMQRCGQYLLSLPYKIGEITPSVYETGYAHLRRVAPCSFPPFDATLFVRFACLLIDMGLTMFPDTLVPVRIGIALHPNGGWSEAVRTVSNWSKLDPLLKR